MLQFSEQSVPTLGQVVNHEKTKKIPVNLLAIHTFIGQPRYLKVLGNTQIMSFYNTEKLCQIDIVTDRLEYFRFYAERMAEKS